MSVLTNCWMSLQIHSTPFLAFLSGGWHILTTWLDSLALEFWLGLVNGRHHQKCCPEVRPSYLLPCLPLCWRDGSPAAVSWFSHSSSSLPACRQLLLLFPLRPESGDQRASLYFVYAIASLNVFQFIHLNVAPVGKKLVRKAAHKDWCNNWYRKTNPEKLRKHDLESLSAFSWSFTPL